MALILATAISPGVELALMEILTDNNIQFFIAPVSAKAQVRRLIFSFNASSLTSTITLNHSISIAFTAIPTFFFTTSIASF